MFPIGHIAIKIRIGPDRFRSQELAVTVHVVPGHGLGQRLSGSNLFLNLEHIASGPHIDIVHQQPRTIARHVVDGHVLGLRRNFIRVTSIQVVHLLRGRGHEDEILRVIVRKAVSHLERLGLARLQSSGHERETLTHSPYRSFRIRRTDNPVVGIGQVSAGGSVGRSQAQQGLVAGIRQTCLGRVSLRLIHHKETHDLVLAREFETGRDGSFQTVNGNRAPIPHRATMRVSFHIIAPLGRIQDRSPSQGHVPLVHFGLQADGSFAMGRFRDNDIQGLACLAFLAIHVDCRHGIFIRTRFGQSVGK